MKSAECQSVSLKRTPLALKQFHGEHFRGGECRALLQKRPEKYQENRRTLGANESLQAHISRIKFFRFQAIWWKYTFVEVIVGLFCI